VTSKDFSALEKLCSTVPLRVQFVGVAYSVRAASQDTMDTDKSVFEDNPTLENDAVPDLPGRKNSAPSVKVRQSFIHNVRSSVSSLQGMQRDNTRSRNMGIAGFFVVLVLCAVMIITNMLAIELLKDMKIDSRMLVDKSTGEAIHVQTMINEIPYPDRSAATEINRKWLFGTAIVVVDEQDGRQGGQYQVVAHLVVACPAAYTQYCHEDGLVYLAFTNLPDIVLYATTDMLVGADAARAPRPEEDGKKITFGYVQDQEFITKILTNAPLEPAVGQRHLLMAGGGGNDWGRWG